MRFNEKTHILAKLHRDSNCNIIDRSMHVMDQDWASKFVQDITSTSNAITLRLPFAHEVLIIHLELDNQHRFHTHIAIQTLVNEEPRAFLYGFNRYPDGEVIGPFYRD